MQAAIDQQFLTIVEVAERLKVNEDTVRRLFLNEPGVIVICFPRKGQRVYRTLRIPESVFQHSAW
jgi:transcriptional regulator GlxA family with amidase domain